MTYHATTTPDSCAVGNLALDHLPWPKGPRGSQSGLKSMLEWEFTKKEGSQCHQQPNIQNQRKVFLHNQSKGSHLKDSRPMQPMHQPKKLPNIQHGKYHCHPHPHQELQERVPCIDYPCHHHLPLHRHNDHVLDVMAIVIPLHHGYFGSMGLGSVSRGCQAIEEGLVSFLKHK